jgi:hypothetical protein
LFVLSCSYIHVRRRFRHQASHVADILLHRPLISAALLTTPHIYSYFHKKRNVSFEKPFFSAIFQTHKNQKMPSFWHFLTDKGPNIISQYDLWTITISTSLGLALKIVIFRIFLSEVLGPSLARKKNFLDKTW